MKASLLEKDDPLQSSSIQSIWHHLAPELRPGIAETMRRRESVLKRESLNMSTRLPHFQSGDGLLNHTSGTYSHSCMMDYPRFPITEMHLGKCPDSMEVQSWKVNFKTEVCAKSAFPHITMHWMKQVEIAKSIDELMTSRSIVGRNDFPDYDMIDAKIASALKKLLTHVHFRKRVSVEEQRAQKDDRLSRGRQIAHMSYEHFRATGAYAAVQGLSDLFTTSFQNDDVQDVDVRWDQALSAVCDMLSDVILEGLYKSKLQYSVQLQPVLALYDQETARNNGNPNYHRLKTAVKLHNDQMMSTRNFRVRSEVVERGSVTRSQKGKESPR